MNKTITVSLTLIGMSLISVPKAAAMLGVSSAAALKVVDAIFMGLGFWTVVSLIAASAGSFAVVWYGIRSVVKRVGKKAAVAW